MEQQSIFSDNRYKQFRRIENLHILFWLIKDLCWVIEWRLLGMFMILPTISVSLYFTWKNSSIPAEFFHNIAITIWIIANSTWMISEFFGFDDFIKPYIWILFVLGLGFLFYYYLTYEILKLKKS